MTHFIKYISIYRSYKFTNLIKKVTFLQILIINLIRISGGKDRRHRHQDFRGVEKRQ